jgi:aldehyde:ferredoxin oxidoreductase
MTGPFCGTLVPMSSRFCIVSKSPHTGTVFETNAGGAFGPELKFAGFDGIIIKGEAKKLVYIKIKDNEVSLENGEFLKGKGIFETERILKESINDPEAKTLAIGPAAENLVSYACIGTEFYRQMGRGGAGTLFGKKKLKGIVCKGTGSIDVANMSSFISRINDYKTNNLFTEDNLWAETDGTPVLVDVTNEMGIHPTRNFRYGINENKDKINSEAIQSVKVSNRACASCPLACGKFTHKNGAEVEGPEYETLCLAGSNCEINEIEHIIQFNRLCDDLGLDTISCGNIIGFAMELTEKNIYDFKLKFGEEDEYLKVIEEIAHLSTERGRSLALGAAKLSEKLNVKGSAAEAKNLEFPAYDPRGSYGMGIAYATSERGACHLRAFPIFAEDPFDIDQLCEEVVDGQNFNALKWSMCICDFWGTVTTDIIADLLQTGLGKTVHPRDLDKSGERIWTLSRLFNISAGYDASNDVLPEKIMKQPLEKGPQNGKVLSQEDFERSKNIYYELRDWDPIGIPIKHKVKQLNLSGILKHESC